MRRPTFLAAGTALLLVLLAAPASADSAIQITGMSCSTLSATGSGLPGNAELGLVVLDQDHDRVLGTLTVATDASGRFKVTDRVRTAGVRDIRLVVNGPDGARIGFADHQMAAGHEMCPLPSTGPYPAPLLVVLGGGLLALGAALLRSQSYRATHLAS